MKIIDRYILKTFLITFITVFVILFFIFILQMVWLFITELAGKDLDAGMVLKFLLFGTPRLIPLVLPLTILLASIMTFGDLSEHYEFAAMKSSGISLHRAIRGLTVFIVMLGFAVFFFANNVIPYAEYKFINFRRNIAKLKPALAITEGKFNEIDNITIKVDKKSGENGEFLEKVIIHKKNENFSKNTTVIRAERGELVSSEESNVLQLVLYDGNYYEDVKNEKQPYKHPFVKSAFKQYVLNIDLSKLNNVNMDEADVSNANNMLNVKELKYTIDSLNIDYNKETHSYIETINNHTTINTLTSIQAAAKTNDNSKLLEGLSKDERLKILRTAESFVINSQYTINGNLLSFDVKDKNISKYVLAFHEKFAVGFACVILFFIGAPLGALIRKGGIGLPLVFAIGIFLAYHFINIFAKKLAEEQGIDAVIGAWLSALILFPFGVYLTYRTTNDIGLFGFDNAFMPINNFFKKINPFKTKEENA